MRKKIPLTPFPKGGTRSGSFSEPPFRKGGQGGFALFAVLLLALTPQALAQGVQVTIDRPEATIQDQLMLSVTVQGSQSAKPQLPDLSNFQVYDRGQSSQFQMSGGRTTVSITYNYVLVPRRPGTFTIGAATVEIDGRTFRSRPFQVRILAVSAEPAESQAVFLTATVSTETPYVGQQVVYTWRFYRRVQVADAQLLAMDFEGLLVEDLGEVREYNTTWGGQRYLVSEIRKALFPQEEGTFTIPPSQLQCQVVVRTRPQRRRSLFDSVFGSQRTEAKVLRSPPIELNVRPLPAAPGDYSGLVGDFKLSGQISKRELKVGESATWKLTVSGTGNVAMISEPKLADLSRFKIYDDKPSSSIERGGSELRGSRSYTKALVPLEPGELTLPPVTLTYFDPEAGSYRKASTAPVTLAVSPAEGKEDLRLTESLTPSAGKVAVRILADDILPVYKGFDAVAAVPFGHRVEAVWLGGFLAPPLLYFVLLWTERRRRHLEANVGLRRHRSALKRALRAFGEVEAAAGRGDRGEAAQVASRLLRGYVGDKVNLEGSAFTPAEAEAQLKRCEVDEALAGETRRLLESLDAAQFGGIPAEEAEKMGTELKPLLKRLESQIRSQGR